MALRPGDCGELLWLDEVRRSLDLGLPRPEGQATIAVADIVGTTGRATDFDGCWRPRQPLLAKRIDQIRASDRDVFNDPIDVIRVDRAYFVQDGHKRVSIAKSDAIEFIDARVSAVSTPYALTPEVEARSIDLTAAEQRFREVTGLLTAAPSARFPVSKGACYAGLQEAVESYAFELSHRLGRLLSREEAAALWYECVYRPTVRAAQEARLPQLMHKCTEGDLFLALHRQAQQLRGGGPRLAQEQADELVSRVIGETDPHHSLLDRLVDHARRSQPTPLLRLLDEGGTINDRPE